MQRDINRRSVNCLQKTETMTEKERATKFLRQHRISGADFTYTTGFDNMVGLLEAYAAQQPKIHKPDVNLEYWQKWLTEHGYQIEFDDDGLWAEDWVQEHKWVDIFDLMMQFAIEQQSKMPTENDIGEEVLSKHYETPEENMAFLDGATFVVEWLRNQIER